MLKREGFVGSFEVVDTEPRRTLRVTLTYGPDGEMIIRHIKRESKPGRRLYRGVGDIPKVLNGVGISIVTTPQGVLSDRECRAKKVGGEILCTVW